ncbi:SEC14-like protein 2 [Orchesella cincta]|uniref:SEC14-like protein 2 n=1 Tax=Orchesella cincta TaxID=48709 RepID=A0A1D2MHC4_ORCCI|nr:SEC14-like protein 2 [Orchesella cincta]
MSQFFATYLVLGVGVLSGVGAISVDKFLSLTLSEKNALDKFRANVSPLLNDDCMRLDTYLIRWLRARNFDINSAERMLKENIRWREENKIGNIKNEDWSDLSGDFHRTIDTYDKIGQPIGVVDLYEWDIRRAMLQGKGQRLLRYVVGLVENITGQVCERQQKGMNVTQVVVLLNTEGFNVIQQACPICLPLWIQFVSVIENYYPEWLDELIAIDATPAVQIVLNAVRPIFSRSTNNAIKVFGPNRSKWMEYLDNKISRSERRKSYGGTKPPFKY